MKEEAADGREKGVAVIVSVNKNRNDAWKLPEDILDLAELEVTIFGIFRKANAKLVKSVLIVESEAYRVRQIAGVR